MTPQDLIALAELADSAHANPEDMRNRLILADLIEVRGETVHLAERGQAYLDHLLAQPLPEQATVWRVPVVGLTVQYRHEGVMQAREMPEPPRMARPSPIPKTPRPPQPEIPTDPETLRVLVRQLTDQGLGQGEIAAHLKITEAQVDAYFHGR